MPYAIAAGGGSVCAVGDGILVSGDDGATWQSGSSGQQYWFAGADAVSATDVWAVDSAGALLHSTDGVRFAEQPDLVRGAIALMGVSFPNASDGWVVGASDQWGDGSVILHTSDSGATWGPQQSNLGGELDGVDFIDAHTGWAISDDNSGWNAGANLTMQHTTDGGVTWIPSSSPATPRSARSTSSTPRRVGRPAVCIRRAIPRRRSSPRPTAASPGPGRSCPRALPPSPGCSS